MVKWVGRTIGALLLLAIVGFFALAPGVVEKGQNGLVAHGPYPVSEAAEQLHETLVIADLHADSLLWNRNLLKRGDRGHADFPRLTEGNVAVQVFTTVTKSPAGQNYDSNATGAWDNITTLAITQLWPVDSWFDLTERGLYMAARLGGYAEKAPETVRILRSRSDLDTVLAARSEGTPTIGALIGSEGGHILEGEIANLGRIYDAGFRLMGLTHFFDNALGGSLHGETGEGLTDFGRGVVREMVERDMIIDLAHASPQMARDVLDMTDVPLIVSHTGIYSHCNVKRNFPDDLMKAIADTGGLIGIGFWEDVTCDASPQGIASAITAAIRVVGVDHVALGSDFDGAVTTELDVSELSALTQALMDSGLTDAEIRAVMGGNTIRFLQTALPQS